MICSLSRSAKLLMFTDDVLLYKPITTHSDLIAFQNDVDTIGHWSPLNHLSLNTNQPTASITLSVPTFYWMASSLSKSLILSTWEYGYQLISPGPSISCRSPARCAGSWAIYLELFLLTVHHLLLWPSTEPRFCPFSITDVSSETPTLRKTRLYLKACNCLLSEWLLSPGMVMLYPSTLNLT